MYYNVWLEVVMQWLDVMQLLSLLQWFNESMDKVQCLNVKFCKGLFRRRFFFAAKGLFLNLPKAYFSSPEESYFKGAALESACTRYRYAPVQRSTRSPSYRQLWVLRYGLYRYCPYRYYSITLISLWWLCGLESLASRFFFPLILKVR